MSEQRFNIIDRRLNPKGKSLSNRQKFIKRAREQLKKAVDKAIVKRKISSDNESETIHISADGLDEPRFVENYEQGRRDRIFPGNKEFMPGDKIKRPEKNKGGTGSEASADGEGEDGFQFVLTRDEFLDLYFENMELPDFIKTTLKKQETREYLRAGYKKDGSPSNINMKLTMRNSLARRICLNRPSKQEIETLENEISALIERNLLIESKKSEKRLADLTEKLERMKRKSKRIPYFDPMDVRYTNFTEISKPSSQAVMFCLMDVSGSMTETHKEMAKNFFMLLHLFLDRQYQTVELVFIRHTHVASEVDEQTFFYSTETGGTIVSSVLEEMKQIIEDRYPCSDWNIYAAQASDGDNLNSDNAQCQALLEEHILPQCQYFAYIEIWDADEAQIFKKDQNQSYLWQAYKDIQTKHQNLAIRRVTKQSDIYPVMQDLFSHDRQAQE